MTKDPDQQLVARALFAHLNDSGVSYCHWKSNQHLRDALAGRTDLDLLVSRNEAPDFRRLVIEHGFKPIISPAPKQYPGVEEFLGLDSATGQLAHLHVHYRLVLGGRYFKNHRLPLEQDLLDSARLKEPEGVMVPAPEWELVLLVTRTLLKTRGIDLLKAILGCPPFPQSIRCELDYITRAVNPAQLEELLATAHKTIPSHLVRAFLRAIQQNQLTASELFKLRREMRQALKPYQRLPPIRATISGLRTIARLIWPGTRPGDKRFASGGVTIGFVGADGAGKSTVVAHIRDWLRWKLDARTFYMGSQQPSWITRCLKLPFRVLRRLHLICTRQLHRDNAIGRLVTALYHALAAAYSLAVAYDRARQARAGRRAAEQGAVVLFDRFPLPALYDAMDGPRVDPGWGRIYGALSRTERQIYARILQPDLVVLLDVNPDTALSRKPDHSQDMLEAKSKAVRALIEDQVSRIATVDAEEPLEKVLLRIQHLLWEML